MPRTNQSSSFSSALSKIGGGAFNEAKKVKDSRGQYEKPNIEDGVYVASLVTARSGEDKNGFGYVAFDFVVSQGTFQGVKLNKFHSIRDRGNRTVEQALASLFIDLQRLCPQEDFAELNEEDVEEIISRLDPTTSINEEELSFQVNVKNNGEYVNVWINKLLGEDGYETEEEEELIPEKGDKVLFQAPRTKTSLECTVTSVNEDKRVVNLKRTKDKKTFKTVAFDHLEWPGT